MRHGRAKSARKTLKFFSLNCNIKPPYKILVDGNFLAASVKQKVPLFDRIGNTLQHQEFALYICRSALDELDSLPGTVFQDARQFGLDECIIIERDEIRPLFDSMDSQRHNHEKSSKVGKKNNSNNTDFREGASASGGGKDRKSSPSEDIQSLVTLPPIISSSSMTTSKRPPPKNNEDHADNTHNPQGYIVATQDETLSDLLRSIPNVPQMHLSRAVLIFESPSAATRRNANFREQGKQMTGGGMMTTEEQEIIKKMKREERTKRREIASGEVDSAVNGMRRKRKAKGPNPLSCKKKKEGDRNSSIQKGDSNPDVKNKQSRRKKKYI